MNRNLSFLRPVSNDIWIGQMSHPKKMLVMSTVSWTPSTAETQLPQYGISFAADSTRAPNLCFRRVGVSSDVSPLKFPQ